MQIPSYSQLNASRSQKPSVNSRLAPLFEKLAKDSWSRQTEELEWKNPEPRDRHPFCKDKSSASEYSEYKACKEEAINSLIKSFRRELSEAFGSKEFISVKTELKALFNAQPNKSNLLLGEIVDRLLSTEKPKLEPKGTKYPDFIPIVTKIEPVQGTAPTDVENLNSEFTADSAMKDISEQPAVVKGSTFSDTVFSRVSSGMQGSIDETLFKELITKWSSSFQNTNSNITVSEKSTSSEETVKVVIDGGKTFEYKRTYNLNGTIQEGLFKRDRVDFHSGNVLVEGRITSDNKTEEGIFAYNPITETRVLVVGKKTYSDGHTQEGRFEYNSEAKAMVLVDGKETFLNGHTHEGRFEYNSEAKAMVLVDGKKTFSNGHTLEGRFEYNSDAKAMVLVKSTVTENPSPMPPTQVIVEPFEM